MEAAAAEEAAAANAQHLARLCSLLRYLGVPTTELLEAVANDGTHAILSALQSCDASTVKALSVRCAPCAREIPQLAEGILRRASAVISSTGDAASIGGILSDVFVHEILRFTRGTGRVFDAFADSTKTLFWRCVPSAFDDEVLAVAAAVCCHPLAPLPLRGFVCSSTALRVAGDGGISSVEMRARALAIAAARDFILCEHMFSVLGELNRRTNGDACIIRLMTSINWEVLRRSSVSVYAAPALFLGGEGLQIARSILAGHPSKESIVRLNVLRKDCVMRDEQEASTKHGYERTSLAWQFWSVLIQFHLPWHSFCWHCCAVQSCNELGADSNADGAGQPDQFAQWLGYYLAPTDTRGNEQIQAWIARLCHCARNMDADSEGRSNDLVARMQEIDGALFHPEPTVKPTLMHRPDVHLHGLLAIALQSKSTDPTHRTRLILSLLDRETAVRVRGHDVEPCFQPEALVLDSLEGYATAGLGDSIPTELCVRARLGGPGHKYLD